MEIRKAINQEVNITAVYFSNKNQLKSFPRRMEFDGREYVFVESGLQYQIKSSDKELRLFDMTDGRSNYRLKFDFKTWILVSIVPSSFAI
jgi:hypothetical protein